ncbi:hypothetical protein WHI96_03540 [Pseudonocardia tropica]|uniref:Uncharacterized protein n=1 Tax=Pseudonocardia tropica TaxID=681289 RepID=A0ABV1JQZ1_9PSEU
MVLLLSIPLLIGVSAGQRWPRPESDFYATTSQIIATLIIAVVLEAFLPHRPMWQDGLDQVLILPLLGFSLLGLFASVRGLIGGPGGPVTGASAAGISAAALLVALALAARLTSSTVAPTGVVLVFVFPAVLMLGWF